MRTPTAVCLSAIVSAAIAAPTALVAHEYLTDGAFVHSAQALFGERNAQGGQEPGQDTSGGTASSQRSGTSTRATTRQSQGTCMVDTVMPNGEGAGSGMVLTSDGTVLTNYHVVNGSTQIRVSMPSGQAYTADVVGHDQSHDIAVLKLRGASGLKTVSLESKAASPGQSVIGVGKARGKGCSLRPTDGS